jgi:hypothetical protein
VSLPTILRGESAKAAREIVGSGGETCGRIQAQES